MVFLSLAAASALGLASGPDIARLPAAEGADAARAPIRQAGSIGKYACTLAALRMENEGLLSLDASVATLLPGYAGPQSEDLTLRRLLENRSGLQDEVIAALMSDPDLPTRSIPALEAANRFGASQSDVEPDAAFDYVNSNWIVVQAILEQAGGAPIADLLEHWVFDPSGASSAAVFVGTLGGEGRDTTQGGLPLPDFISCAGALEARPSDLLALVAYPFESEDFDDDDRAQLTTVTSPAQVYTLGGRFETVLDADGRARQISWQNGNNGPWFAVALYDPDTGEGLAVMSAEGGDEALALRDAWLEERGLTRAPRPTESRARPARR